MDGDTVDVGVVHEPDDLIGEELSIILGGEVGLSGFGGVQLQALADAFPQDVQRRVGLHDLSHGLLDQRLASREPVTVATAETWANVSLHRESDLGFPPTTHIYTSLDKASVQWR